MNGRLAVAAAFLLSLAGCLSGPTTSADDVGAPEAAANDAVIVHRAVDLTFGADERVAAFQAPEHAQGHIRVALTGWQQTPAHVAGSPCIQVHWSAPDGAAAKTWSHGDCGIGNLVIAPGITVEEHVLFEQRDDEVRPGTYAVDVAGDPQPATLTVDVDLSTVP